MKIITTILPNGTADLPNAEFIDDSGIFQQEDLKDLMLALLDLDQERMSYGGTPLSKLHESGTQRVWEWDIFDAEFLRAIEEKNSESRTAY